MTNRIFIISTICILFIWDSYAQQIKPASAKTIKIGLLISNSKSVAARNGAELAISKANEEEGPDGLHFQLIVKSMEGPWGTGSKEPVNLVFNDTVWALMGSNDGRNAHLIEQVIAKTHIIFLSAWASDPTLSQAFVPWYFNCVPNNIQQADVLIEEIYNKRNLNKIAVVSDNSYDSRLALQSFVDKTKKAGKEEPIQFFLESSAENLFLKIRKEDINCFVLFGQPSASVRFIKQFRQNNMNQPVFGTLSLLGENNFEDVKLTSYNNVVFVTSGNWLTSSTLEFQKEFKKKYSKIPGAIAAYAFDGMNLIMEAIKHSGLDREKMQKTMSKTHYKGVTGSIQFDKMGNREGAVELIQITDGIPVTIDK